MLGACAASLLTRPCTSSLCSGHAFFWHATPQKKILRREHLRAARSTQGTNSHVRWPGAGGVPAQFSACFCRSRSTSSRHIEAMALASFHPLSWTGPTDLSLELTPSPLLPTSRPRLYFTSLFLSKGPPLSPRAPSCRSPGLHLAFPLAPKCFQRASTPPT
jgi:hypothetical protein